MTPISIASRECRTNMRYSPCTGTKLRGRAIDSRIASSPWRACPLSCTCATPAWMTSAPRRASPSITFATAHSLPGMACELSTTTSPSSMRSHRLSPEAICASADIGSPWEPVEITQISPGLWSPIDSMSANDRSGIVKAPSSRARPTFFCIERPSSATLRPLAMAASASCWMRCT